MIISRSAIHQIDSVPADQRVVAVETVDDIVAGESEERIVANTAADGVVEVLRD